MMYLIVLLLLIINLSVHAQNDIKITDPVKFFGNFFNSKVEKNEFETSEAFAQRLVNHFKKIDTDQIYFFNSIWSTQYSADNEFFFVIHAIPTKTESHYGAADFENQDILVKEDIKKTKSYKTSNAMGSRVVVSVYKKNHYYFSFIDISKSLRAIMSKESKLIFTSDSILIGTSPNKAKQIKNDIAVALGINLFPSLSFTAFEKKTDYKEPTFTDPNEVYTTEYYIPAILREIVIYNKKTNRLIKRLENPYELSE